jgi:capsular exopolysaccharide synthesis family protein
VILIPWALGFSGRPLPSETLDRPLRNLAQPVPVIGHTADSAHLREYLAVILKRKWLILTLAIVATSLTAIQMYRLPNIYEAVVEIVIEQKTRNVLQTQGLIVREQRDPAFWSTQLKLLENPLLARQVILLLDLQSNPDFLGGQAAPSIVSSVRRVFSRRPREKSQAGLVPTVNYEAEEALGPEKLTPAQMEQLEPYEDAVRANLVVEPVEKTNLVRIRFTHSDPVIAMKVANTLADVFRVNDVMRETYGSTDAADKLAQHIAELQLKIKQGEGQRIEVLKNSGLPLNPKAQGINITLERLQTLSGQLLAAEMERKNIQAAYKAALETKDSNDIWSIPEVLGDPIVQNARSKIRDLEQARSAMLVQYTPEWPEVKKIDEQIKHVEREMKKSPVEIITAMKARLDAAEKKVGKLRQDYDHEREDANKQGLSEIQMSNLNQELETNKQFYNTLYQRQKELELTSNDKFNNISIAAPARQPRAPIGPKRVRNIVIALLLSLGAGIGLAFLLDYLDDTLKSIEDVDRHVHLPTLALIPAPRAERMLLRGRGAVAAEDDDGNMAASDNTALALIKDVRSPITEAYRHLRTSLLLSSAGQPPKTMLVTSSQPSEGKTTTAINTAVMLAQTGAEVLLLDCDLRRPRIHTHFGMTNARGVTNFLSGETDLEALIQTYDKLPNLKVLTSGPVPPSAAELLGSDEMRKLLYALGERFAHIVIDSPPAISFTDASILSTMVDGVILVVHGGRSSRAVVRRAKQQLLDVGAHIFGIVLNNVKLESGDSYYYAGYYSGYYTTEEDNAADMAAEAAGADRRGTS